MPKWWHGWPAVLLAVGVAAYYAASPRVEGACVVRGAGAALDGVFAPVLRTGAAQPLIKSAAGTGGGKGAAWVRIGPALSRLPDALALLGGRVVAAIPALEIARGTNLGAQPALVFAAGTAEPWRLLGALDDGAGRRCELAAAAEPASAKPPSAAAWRACHDGSATPARELRVSGCAAPDSAAQRDARSREPAGWVTLGSPRQTSAARVGGEPARGGLRELLGHPVTALLLASNLATAWHLHARRVPVDAVALSYDAVVRRGEYWRVVSASFAHFDLLHLGFNMMSLYNLMALEALFGSLAYASLTATLVPSTIVTALGITKLRMLHAQGRLSTARVLEAFGRAGAALHYARMIESLIMLVT